MLKPVIYIYLIDKLHHFKSFILLLLSCSIQNKLHQNIFLFKVYLSKGNISGIKPSATHFKSNTSFPIFLNLAKIVCCLTIFSCRQLFVFNTSEDSCCFRILCQYSYLYWRPSEDFSLLDNLLSMTTICLDKYFDRLSLDDPLTVLLSVSATKIFKILIRIVCRLTIHQQLLFAVGNARRLLIAYV